MNKATTRAATLAFQEVDTNPHIHRRLRNLRTVDEEQRVRRKTMQAELEVLRKNTMIFGQYKPEVFGRLEEESANESISQIIKFCPTLFQLLFGLCQNSEETTPQTQNYARIAMIVSITCFSRHPRLSNCLQVFLTLLLHSSGAKRHVFALTQSFGFTESYDSVMSTVRGLRSKALDAIADRFQATPHAIAYDNCDVYLGVSEQGNKKGETANFRGVLSDNRRV